MSRVNFSLGNVLDCHKWPVSREILSLLSRVRRPIELPSVFSTRVVNTTQHNVRALWINWEGWHKPTIPSLRSGGRRMRNSKSSLAT